MKVILSDEEKKELFDKTFKYVIETEQYSSYKNLSPLERAYKNAIRIEMDKILKEFTTTLLTDSKVQDKLKEIGSQIVSQLLDLHSDTIVNSIIEKIRIDNDDE